MGKIIIKTIFNKIFFWQKKKTWKDIEYFDERWKERIKNMSFYIAPNERILDIGCGKMWLKEFLKETNTYIPADYKKRGDDCIVIDLNKKEFPDIKVDVIFASGVMEYVKDVDWFVKNISLNCDKCIISYCTTNNFPDIKDRISLKWVNNLSDDDVITLFSKYKLNLTNRSITSTNNSIFVFEK